MGGFEQSYENKLRDPHYGKATKLYATNVDVQICKKELERGVYAATREHQRNGTVCEMFDGILPTSIEEYADGLRRYAYAKMQVGIDAYVRKQKVSPENANAKLSSIVELISFFGLASQLCEGHAPRRKSQVRQSLSRVAKTSIPFNIN